MFAKTLTLAAMAALTAATMAPTAAEARHWDRGDYYGRGYDGHGGGYRGDRYYGRGYYGDRGYYRGRGYYGRGYRCRDSGTGGTIIGAIAGGLLGSEIA